MIVSANLKAFIIEGFIIGMLISSMTTFTSYLSEWITGDREDRRVHWGANLTMAIIIHVITETFRHDRFVELVQGGPKFVQYDGPRVRRSATNLNFDDVLKMQ